MHENFSTLISTAAIEESMSEIVQDAILWYAL